jgi:hypothetical protein
MVYVQGQNMSKMKSLIEYGSSAPKYYFFGKMHSNSKRLSLMLLSGWRFFHKHKIQRRYFNTVEEKEDDDHKTTSKQNVKDSEITSTAHPVHHYLAGGMPCDPKPKPFLLAEYGEESLHSLILLRHGESEWNSQNRYTGW